MSARLDEFLELLDYDAWARGRTLDAAEALSPADFERDLGSSFPSVRATLVHVLSADWIWLRRWLGESPSAKPDDWRLETLADIRALWDDVAAERARFLADLDDAALDRVVSYRDLSGRAWDNPLHQLLRHAVNHATYHRGQLTTMLRQLGAQPVSTDLVLYFRTRA